MLVGSVVGCLELGILFLIGNQSAEINTIVEIRIPIFGCPIGKAF
jgi:hypothetical protein